MKTFALQQKPSASLVPPRSKPIFSSPRQSLLSPNARTLADLCTPLVQPKFTVNEPGDKYEQEADWMAAEVMRSNADQSQFSVPTGTQKSDSSKGHTLSKNTVAAPTPYKGHSFSKIRVTAPPMPVQPKLTVNQPGDRYEQEADRVAEEVMRSSSWFGGGISFGNPPNVQKKCAACASDGGLCPNCAEEERLQRKPLAATITPLIQCENESASNHNSQVAPQIAANIESLRGGGQPLPPSVQAFFEPRFDADFSSVRIHTDAQAAQIARSVNARAFTVGREVVFGAGQFAPGTSDGQRLLGHELTHVVQQGIQVKGRSKLIQRRLESRPSIQGDPCACLVFIHNDERNARRAAENLHQHCRYNLAIISAGRSREIPIPGGSGNIDPNELFPPNIQEECMRDDGGCRAYAESHNDLRSMQIQFFRAIKECSDNFTLPTIALHNNVIRETSSFRRAVPAMGHEIAALREDIDRETQAGRGSREDLRNRLQSVGERAGGDFSGLMVTGGTTNIFRWCNLPEISRCHIGDPLHPDHVVWVTNENDYERLRQEHVNVVLQTASGPESGNDLSTLFWRLGADARFVNIETPIRPRDYETRLSNMIFVLQNLSNIGLNCCNGTSPSRQPTSSSSVSTVQRSPLMASPPQLRTDTSTSIIQRMCENVTPSSAIEIVRLETQSLRGTHNWAQENAIHTTTGQLNYRIRFDANGEVDIGVRNTATGAIEITETARVRSRHVNGRISFAASPVSPASSLEFFIAFRPSSGTPVTCSTPIVVEDVRALSARLMNENAALRWLDDNSISYDRNRRARFSPAVTIDFAQVITGFEFQYEGNSSNTHTVTPRLAVALVRLIRRLHADGVRILHHLGVSGGTHAQEGYAIDIAGLTFSDGTVILLSHNRQDSAYYDTSTMVPTGVSARDYMIGIGNWMAAHDFGQILGPGRGSGGHYNHFHAQVPRGERYRGFVHEEENRPQ